MNSILEDIFGSDFDSFTSVFIYSKLKSMDIKNLTLNYVKDNTSKKTSVLKIIKREIEEIRDMDFDICCSGRECGCMGLPLDPEYYVLGWLNEIIERI